ncbi:MAG: winged helix-turn-helix transcriptional regulator [Lachnospiraceae bacterium]|nr:winged helix-turn-helix transcriptional regulator [Lachnospiraceae bacterium]
MIFVHVFIIIRHKEKTRRQNILCHYMLTKCLRELEQDKFITRTQYPTIPPTVEYSLAERGKTLIPALESVYKWADEQMQDEGK